MRTRFSVFLITLSGLILEVGLTRIYSASIWYHFAFVAISVALLGWGLGGFTVHLLKKVRPMTMNAAALTTLLYAGAVPLCLWLLVRFPYEVGGYGLYFIAPVVQDLAGQGLAFGVHVIISTPRWTELKSRVRDYLGTKVEFRLLASLIEAGGRVLSRDQLLDAVYGNDQTEVLDRTVDVHIGRLRDKLGDDAEHPRYVATVRGVGYRVAPP